MATTAGRLQPDIPGMLQVLGECGVRFVVVGGVAAAAHGLPIKPGDVDIRSECSADNLLRLSVAMGKLGARPAPLRSRRYRHPMRVIARWKRAISAARREGYSWPHIAGALCGWVLGRSLRAVRRRPDPITVFGPQQAHEPFSRSPAEFGLAHAMTVFTDCGLLSYYLYESSEFELVVADARQLTVDGVTVDVSSLDSVIFVNRTFARFKDRLRSRQLRQLRRDAARNR